MHKNILTRIVVRDRELLSVMASTCGKASVMQFSEQFTHLTVTS